MVQGISGNTATTHTYGAGSSEATAPISANTRVESSLVSLAQFDEANGDKGCWESFCDFMYNAGYYLAWPFIQLYNWLSDLCSGRPSEQHFFHDLVEDPKEMRLQLCLDAKLDPLGTTYNSLAQLVHYPEQMAEELLAFFNSTQPTDRGGQGSEAFLLNGNDVSVQKREASTTSREKMKLTDFTKQVIALLPHVSDQLLPSLKKVFDELRELNNDGTLGLDAIAQVLKDAGLGFDFLLEPDFSADRANTPRIISSETPSFIDLLVTYPTLPKAAERLEKILEEKTFTDMNDFIRQAIHHLGNSLEQTEKGLFDREGYFNHPTTKYYIPTMHIAPPSIQSGVHNHGSVIVTVPDDIQGTVIHKR